MKSRLQLAVNWNQHATVQLTFYNFQSQVRDGGPAG